MGVKLHGPDYKDVADKENAVDDFLQRIRMYEKAYQPLDDEHDDELSYIKIINVGQKFQVNRVKDHIQSKIVYYLMNVKVGRGRTIYLTRHGESQFNVMGKIGGDSGISPNGLEYARQMGEYVNTTLVTTTDQPKLKIWVSELQRTHQTAAFIDQKVESWKVLNEINAGICEGMTYKEIEHSCPDVHTEREQDKYNYRYPMGESYYDLVQRLEPVIMELEKRDHVLVICHQAVMRCILAYFQEVPYQQLPYLKCPLHTLLKLEPKPYGCDVEHIKFDIKAVSTHRDKPDGTEADAN